MKNYKTFVNCYFFHLFTDILINLHKADLEIINLEKLVSHTLGITPRSLDYRSGMLTGTSKFFELLLNLVYPSVQPF